MSVVAVTGLTHPPHPDTYDCMTCARPWPCLIAQDELLEQYDSLSALAMFLTAHLLRAIDMAKDDKRVRDTDGLYDRFLSWIRRPKPMLRNHLLAQINAFENEPVGVLLNGVFVSVTGVWKNSEPAGIALSLDVSELEQALKAEGPDQLTSSGNEPGPSKEDFKNDDSARYFKG